MAPTTRSTSRARGTRLAETPTKSDPTQNSAQRQVPQLPVLEPVVAPPPNMVMLSMEAYQKLIQAAAANQEGGGDVDSTSMTREFKYLRDFRKYDPPVFEGKTIDPVLVESWVESIETIFEHMKCPEDQKVKCASFMLKGEAHFWWKTAQQTLRKEDEDEEPICWHEMKRAFIHKYYPAVNWYNNREAFLHLKQGNMTVEDPRAPLVVSDTPDSAGLVLTCVITVVRVAIGRQIVPTGGNEASTFGRSS
ncbi:uncharacterized protein LOC111467258 isoform X2 [Cucurbita maxima]|uniref:Uncharacterized protein LOC111467258 isoform X2 n=1 Tax=Cucurbita maxima TaxID=3661 RepID=A0A6J1HWE2_CUCMA|nr:uncharacterized protein LOC111467258 isoform X2 [Cucurbita maxima]